MCVALATIGKNKPALSILKACEAANPHGGGVAWIEKNRVRFEKGLNAEQIHAIIQRENGPFLIHFRIATVGNVKPELCHPFPVGGKASIALSGTAGAVLAHNGTWYNWKTVITRAARAMSAKLPEGPLSDSRAMAWLVAQVGERAFNNVAGRFAYFTSKNGIKLFGDWKKLSGFYASNLNWRARLETPRSKSEAPKRSYSNDSYWNHFNEKNGVAYTKALSLYDQVQFELEGGE